MHCLIISVLDHMTLACRDAIKDHMCTGLGHIHETLGHSFLQFN